MGERGIHPDGYLSLILGYPGRPSVTMNSTDQPSDFPQLESNRLVLRRLTLKDVDFIFQHFSNPEVNRFLLDDDPVTRREQAEEIIRFYLEPFGKTYNRWGIVQKVSGALMGTSGYHNWNNRDRRAEIGYDLSPAFWGLGFMTEALREVLHHGFEGMWLNKIQAIVHPENTRSASLLEKLGFQKEGLLRQYHRVLDEYYDHLLYSLLRTDLRA